MAKARKNSYRLTFSLPDGRRVQFTAHTQAESASVTFHVNALISSQRTGTSSIMSLEWANRLPEGTLKRNLVSWGLIADTSRTDGKTISDIVEFFRKKKGVTAGTIGTFNDFAKNLFNFFGESKKLATITPSDAYEFENYLRSTEARLDNSGEPLAESTVLKRLERARQFFGQAVKLEWIKRNPFINIHGGTAVNPEKWRYISVQQTLDVMDNTPSLEIKAMVAVYRFAGCRGVSELRSLEWNADWIIWSEPDRQGTIRLFRSKTQKSGDYETIVPMTKRLEESLRNLFDQAPAGTRFVFGRRTNPGQTLKRVFLRNGIDIVTPYNFRRSYCRDLLESGLDTKAYEVYAGHKLSMGLKHYQQWDTSRAAKSAPIFLKAFEAENQTEAGGTKPDPENTSTQFGTHQVHNSVHSRFSQNIVENNENNDLSLENTGSSLDKKSPCNNMQELVVGATRFDHSPTDPVKYNMSVDSENTSTQFGTQSNYFEQIVRLFDGLSMEEQQQLFDVLAERIKSDNPQFVS